MVFFLITLLLWAIILPFALADDGWEAVDGVYWAFVTFSTVGLGDKTLPLQNDTSLHGLFNFFLFIAISAELALLAAVVTASADCYVAAHAMTPDATTLSKAATEAATTLTGAIVDPAAAAASLSNVTNNVSTALVELVSTLVPEDPEGQTALEAPRPGSLEKTDRPAERDDSRATELLDTLDLELHDARP